MQTELLWAEDAVRRVRRNWAFARDNGEWDAMRACFHPDATVRVLWYSGPVAAFLEQTIAGAAKRKPGEKSTRHWLGNSRARVMGERALLETDAMVLNRDRFLGHLFDFTINLRLYDRVERRGGEWRILRMDAIYDKDRLDPVIPGSVPPDFFAGVRFEGPDAAIGFAKWRIEKRGGEVPADLPIGGTDSEKALRTAAETWLNAGPTV